MVHPKQVISPDLPGRKVGIIGCAADTLPAAKHVVDADVLIHHATSPTVCPSYPEFMHEQPTRQDQSSPCCVLALKAVIWLPASSNKLLRAQAHPANKTESVMPLLLLSIQC